MDDRISRGKLMSLLVSVPVTIAVGAAAASASDDSGGTKVNYNYISMPGPEGQRCIACTLFVSPAACPIVKGKISPNGYCIAIAPRANRSGSP